MKTSNVLNTIGLCLLGAVFLWSAQRVVRPTKAATADNGVVTLRFAHWQLEGGLRETLDQLSREYEKLHPGVRIEQLGVPERVYPQWVTTQLVGGTVPDLVAIQGKSMPDERLARFFVPLTSLVEKPNPYNRGTELENTPLRETFIDGMRSTLSFNQNLLEYYGIPLSMFTVRIYYNRTLWREILGDRKVPTDFDDFIALCDEIRAFSERERRPLIPIAGSRDNAPNLTLRLFTSQTQKLNQRLDVLHELKPLAQQAALAYLRGDWSLRDLELERAMEATRAAGLNFQPGFTQLGRDDATFYFVQGRALMIATGSWDSPSFRMQANFEIDAFNIPIPSPDHPRYGPQIMGPASESDTGTGLSFGIPRSSPNFDRAFDFLLFLTSKKMNAEFSRLSGWLPAVVGITPPAELIPFLPRTTGYVDGFSISQFGADSAHLQLVNTNILYSPAGSVESYRAAMEAGLTQAIQSDLRRLARRHTNNISYNDLIIAGQAGLRGFKFDEDLNRVSQLLEAQNRSEAQMAWHHHELTRLGSASEPAPTAPPHTPED